MSRAINNAHMPRAPCCAILACGAIPACALRPPAPHTAPSLPSAHACAHERRSTPRLARGLQGIKMGLFAEGESTVCVHTMRNADQVKQWTVRILNVTSTAQGASPPGTRKRPLDADNLDE